MESTRYAFTCQFIILTSAVAGSAPCQNTAIVVKGDTFQVDVAMVAGRGQLLAHGWRIHINSFDTVYIYLRYLPLLLSPIDCCFISRADFIT